MKITLLVDLQEHETLSSEFGLSFLLESADGDFLFDTGSGKALIENLAKLNIPSSKVRQVILSHGHYDHTGGLRRFLELNDHAPVYVSCHAFGRFYNVENRYIGMDPSLKEHPRLILTEDETVIAEQITLCPGNSLPCSPSLGTFGLRVERNGRMVDDDFLHEQYLLVRENGNRILLSGCAHKGILEILSQFHPDVFIGGMHLSKLSPSPRLDPIARCLAQLPTAFYTCHCTGTEQYKYMKGTVPRLEYLSTGTTVLV